MGKHSVSRLSYLFTHLHLLSSYASSSTLLFSNLSLLSASSLLCFSSVHIVGSLTSKLPSIKDGMSFVFHGLAGHPERNGGAWESPAMLRPVAGPWLDLSGPQKQNVPKLTCFY